MNLDGIGKILVQRSDRFKVNKLLIFTIGSTGTGRTFERFPRREAVSRKSIAVVQQLLMLVWFLALYGFAKIGVSVTRGVLAVGQRGHIALVS